MNEFIIGELRSLLVSGHADDERNALFRQRWPRRNTE
jgi:hypothetical protein